MVQFNLPTLERVFVLSFGIAHFLIPLLLPPNFVEKTLVFNYFRIADFVIPGCLAVAFLAISYFFSKRLLFGASLAFLYFGGIIFHSLYLLGLFPSVLTIAGSWVPVGGILIDISSIFAIFDYYRTLT